MAVHVCLLYHLLIIAAAPPTSRAWGDKRTLAHVEANLGFRRSRADTLEFLLL